MNLLYYSITFILLMSLAYFFNKRFIKIALHINSGAPLENFERKGIAFLESKKCSFLFLGLSLLFLILDYFVFTNILSFIFVGVISIFLLSCLFLDMSFKLLPDVYTIPLMFLGLSSACLDVFSINIESSLIGGAIMFIIFFGVEKIGALFTDKIFLGGGDIKLLMAFGFIFGIVDSVVILFMSSFVMLGLIAILSILRKNYGKEIPFGIGLTIVAMVNIFYPSLIDNILAGLII